MKFGVMVSLSNERKVIERWKQRFDEHLNSTESAGSEGEENEGNVMRQYCG